MKLLQQSSAYSGPHTQAWASAEHPKDFVPDSQLLAYVSLINCMTNVPDAASLVCSVVCEGEGEDPCTHLLCAVAPRALKQLCTPDEGKEVFKQNYAVLKPFITLTGTSTNSLCHSLVSLSCVTSNAEHHGMCLCPLEYVSNT